MLRVSMAPKVDQATDDESLASVGTAEASSEKSKTGVPCFTRSVSMPTPQQFDLITRR